MVMATDAFDWVEDASVLNSIMDTISVHLKTSR